MDNAAATSQPIVRDTYVEFPHKGATVAGLVLGACGPDHASVKIVEPGRDYGTTLRIPYSDLAVIDI